jgi:hypothetical protein
VLLKGHLVNQLQRGTYLDDEDDADYEGGREVSESDARKFTGDLKELKEQYNKD